MDIMMLIGAETGPVGWFLNVLNFAMAGGMAIWAFKRKVPKGPIVEGFGVVSYLYPTILEIDPNSINHSLVVDRRCLSVGCSGGKCPQRDL
jgi:hypothetical protein